ncbi:MULTISPECIES: transcriptional repressor LexA [Paraclostridium]|uniref:LexA repressor n=1 Tax=Paraclostridium benzoelyticum TaxID=1629550 RepID=A0A0M3DD22_9FIRM|nr:MULTISPECIES: transcriptional repressor LexA [Paraclostridium]KKY00183.1 LexA family transcriptional regulator [Paraclostridium benzoelyticum]MCU9816815.1 transcriptional repressor LexA [Paraclostridium sp. AKS73]OXX83062.1 LexA family transcriptional regulator [Paraclostridium benzoelyticum]
MYLDLTNKQIMILEFIKDQLTQKGYPPSVREICAAVDLRSTSTVHSHLNKLEKLGYIRRDATKPRAIEVLDSNKGEGANGLNQEVLHLPVLGQITAGEPIFAEQNIEEYIPLPANFIVGKDNFILKVKGESMINAGILDGDYVIVDKATTAYNSQIVVALVRQDSATVKRFFKEENHIRLQPENDFMEPIILDPSEVSVLGHVRGVFRVIK